MTKKAYHVLFLCKGNAERSIMAEALLNFSRDSRFHAYSAGIDPRGAVHPFALEQVQAAGGTPERLRSKSWDEFAASGAPQLDLVVTMCNTTAAEGVRSWPGQPATVHWDVCDPAAAKGTEGQVRRVFAAAWREIRCRLEHLRALPLEQLDKSALQHELEKLRGVQP